MVAAVECMDVGFQVSGNDILRSINICIPQGEYCSIVGPNGAGKSTVLKILARIISPTSGNVRIGGRDASAMSSRDYARLIGYVPQHLHTEFPHTVEDFVLMGLYPLYRGWSTIMSEQRHAVAEALALVGMTKFGKREMRTLSGGERQKVLIAGALVHRPALLLLDEPTTFLDPQHEQETEELLGRIRQDRGATIVSVTHNLNLGALNSDSVIALREGRIVFAGGPADFMQAEVLRSVFHYEFELVAHPRSNLRMVVPRTL